MDVQVRDGLPRRGPDVDSDVETVGLMTAEDRLPGDIDALEEAGPLPSRGHEPRCHVSARHD